MKTYPFIFLALPLLLIPAEALSANRLPEVAITAPAQGATYLSPAVVALTISASSPEGKIAKVELYYNNIKFATLTEAPFTYTTTPIREGKWALTAKAIDNLGGETLSAPVNINVVSNLPPLANAGADTMLILPANTLVLKGSGSDTGNLPLSYLWSGPPGVAFSAANTAGPTATFPAITGTYILTLTVTDGGTPPLKTTDDMVVSVFSKPAITSPESVSGTAGSAFSYTLTGSGFPLPTLSATNFPAWLTYNPASAVLSGTPPTAGSTTVSLSADNPAGKDIKTLTINVGQALTQPAFTSPLSYAGTVGSSLSYTLTATGFPAPAFSTAALPAGLTFSGAQISGTPIDTGVFTVSLTAVNSQGSDVKILVLTIHPAVRAPVITSDLQDTVRTTEKQRTSFTVTATGLPAPTFKWQFLSGAAVTDLAGNGPTYILDSTSLAAAGRYRVIASNGTNPPDTSNSSFLIVIPLPVVGVGSAVLLPGNTYNPGGGYVLSNPEGQGVAVRVQPASADSLGLKGFRDVQYAFTLSPAEANTSREFPGIKFDRSDSEKRSLYKVEGGVIYFISSADTVILAQPGIYFMGVDILPPSITYLGESFGPEDSTEVRFSVQDNVANLVYDLKRTDNPLMNLGRQPIASLGTLVFRLKNPPGLVKSLGLQLSVRDHQLSTFHPTEQSPFLSLSQKLDEVEGPPLWSIGVDAKYLWDLVSLPLDPDPPVTLQDLGKSNGLDDVQGAVWSDDLGEYESMKASETLLPGRSYWLASRTSLHSFRFTNAVLKGNGTRKFSVRLKHGWNQVGNPSLENLYWPIARNSQDLYRSSPIKGLWKFDSGNDTAAYSPSDSLEPWKGYFVYNFLEDTTLVLSSHPIAGPGQKISGSANAGEVHMSMGWGSAAFVLLGASERSSTGLGWEDELALPKREGRHSLGAVRQGRRLTSDWIRLDRDSVLKWNVSLENAPKANAAAPLRIMELGMPEGFEAWAVSRVRSMKFKLEAGQEIPTSGLPKDTLLILAGTPERLARMGELQGKLLEAPPVNLLVTSRRGGFQLDLSLPGNAGVRASLWTLGGYCLGEMRFPSLAEGRYQFAFQTDFRSRPKVLSPGMYFLDLQLQGPGLSNRLVRKIAVPD